MTDWGTDPDFLGAYAYAPPGKAGSRIIARPDQSGTTAWYSPAKLPPQKASPARLPVPS